MLVSWAVLLAIVPAGREGVAQNNAYHRSDEPFGQLPTGRAFGPATGVSAAPDGRSIWVVDRCGENNCADRPNLNPIFRFDLSGQLTTEFGAGLFAWPHGLHVDRTGNVWVTDAAASRAEPPGMGHVIYKFSPEGQLLLTLGRRGVPGRDQTTFNKPSGVVVSPGGDIYVADGHGVAGSNRIVKLDSTGAYIKEWGSTGTQAGQFQEAHSIAMDSQGRIFVGDRGNRRIQVFDPDGNHLITWTQFGRPGGIHIDDDVLYSTDSGLASDLNPEGRPGVYIGSARDGTITGFIPDPLPDSGAEPVSTDALGNVYVGEAGAVRVYRLEPPPP